MHVASLSKILTAIAMTKLLGDLGISPSTAIIDYLPAYWVKGPNVQNITFFDLLAHTSGLAFNNANSRSDFAWMKAQIEVGTYCHGAYSYQNLNYGLCRILLATVNRDVPVDGSSPAGRARSTASGTPARSPPTRRTWPTRSSGPRW